LQHLYSKARGCFKDSKARANKTKIRVFKQYMGINTIIQDKKLEIELKPELKPKLKLKVELKQTTLN
jgi:hypothetical protein